MYKIKEFVDMIGVSTKTLRNKDKKGLLTSTYVKPGCQYRLYSDELAYIYDDSRYILAYLSQTDDIDVIEGFRDKLDSLNIKYKIFISDNLSVDCFDNNAIRELLKEANANNTYTVLYDEENVLERDLKAIKFYLNAYLSYIKIKKIEDFSLEKSSKLMEV